MRIIGIDPGFGRIGYGVIEKKANDWIHVAHGLIETSPKQAFVDRLLSLEHDLKKLFAIHKPTHAAVEELFFYKNVTTAIQVGEARGVILLTLAHAGLAIDECTPLEVKQAITGYGRAEKKQVQTMVQMILGLPKKPLQDDAADALAVALASGQALKMKQILKK